MPVYILNLRNVVSQLYLNKAGGRMKYSTVSNADNRSSSGLLRWWFSATDKISFFFKSFFIMVTLVDENKNSF